jgi:predicted RNA-binding Zn ribbon-like protein
VNPAHLFNCGNLALDFAATLRERRSTRSETLATPARLDAWYLESGIVDALSPSAQPDLAHATVAREAVYVLVTARLLKWDYDPEALDLVNRTARRPAAVPQLTPSGRRTEATPDEALSTLAREAVELLSGSDAALLKECENPECTTVYLDRSRGGRRQWCSMDPCGNKIKAAAYRARKRANPA